MGGISQENKSRKVSAYPRLDGRSSPASQGQLRGFLSARANGPQL